MKGSRPALKAVTGGLLRAPKMPDALPSSMGSVWQATAADLVGRRLLTTSQLPVLETYVGAVWLARECRKCIEDHGILVLAKDGQRKPNPALAGLAKAQDNIARLADDLGISAVSRNRPGIKKSEAPTDGNDAAGLGL